MFNIISVYVYEHIYPYLLHLMPEYAVRFEEPTCRVIVIFLR